MARRMIWFVTLKLLTWVGISLKITCHMASSIEWQALLNRIYNVILRNAIVLSPHRELLVSTLNEPHIRKSIWDFSSFSRRLQIISDGSMDANGSRLTFNLSSTMTTANQTFNVFERLTWTEFLNLHSPLALHVDRAITPVWYIIGIAGNIISAKIWLTRHMRLNNSSAVYLATLSITDMIFLLLHILQELKYAWEVRTLGYPVLCEGYFLLVLCAQYLSPLLVLGFTVERYIAVCHPFKKEKYCTISRALRVVLILVIISLLLCCIQAYFWTYDAASKECIVRPEAHNGLDSSLWSIWTWITEMLVFLLVPLIILIFNILVIREVRKISSSGQAMAGPTPQKSSSGSGAATTVMLLSVSFYVIFTTLPATLVYALVSEFPEGDHSMTDAEIQQDPGWTRYLYYITGRKIVEEICLSHYACNFFLYFITGSQFRRVFIEMLKCSVRSYWSTHNGKYTEVSQRNSFPNTAITRVWQLLISVVAMS